MRIDYMKVRKVKSLSSNISGPKIDKIDKFELKLIINFKFYQEKH